MMSFLQHHVYFYSSLMAHVRQSVKECKVNINHSDNRREGRWLHSPTSDHDEEERKGCDEAKNLPITSGPGEQRQHTHAARPQHERGGSDARPPSRRHLLKNCKEESIQLLPTRRASLRSSFGGILFNDYEGKNTVTLRLNSVR